MIGTPPFDGLMFVYVLLVVLGLIVAMRFVPPIGARYTLGRAVDRYAHVPAEDLEDAVEEEGRRTYLSWRGLSALVVLGCLLRIAMYYSSILNHSLKAAGVISWVALVASVLPVIPVPYLNRWAMRRLLVRRLDGKFGHA